MHCIDILILISSNETLCYVMLGSSSFEGLTLYRRMMSLPTSDAWLVLNDYLSSSRQDKIYRLTIEIRLTRKGFDVTDFLEVPSPFISISIELLTTDVCRKVGARPTTTIWRSVCSRGDCSSIASKCLCWPSSARPPTGTNLSTPRKYKIFGFLTLYHH